MPPPSDLAAVPLIVAGVDEAGRGCLAGPVYAAAVILAPKTRIRGLDDSKKLPPDQRETLYEKITERAQAWGIGVADVGEIDSVNILQATFIAMRRAVAALAVTPGICWVDGNQDPRLPMPAKTIVDGDALKPCIMAASILAKVARDRAMVAMDEQFPGYGFARHKGYGTPEHLAALRSLGPSSIHRMTFAPCAQRGLFDELPLSEAV